MATPSLRDSSLRWRETRLVRVVFVNRYFHPDHSATSQMASDLAFHLASRGWEVVAITSRQRYDDPRARLPKRETANGVRIVRVWSTRFGRAGLVGRAIDYLTFYSSAFFAMRRERDAIVVAMTDPPLLSVVAALASRRVVNWVQDLFPEVAEALGIRAAAARRLRDWSLRRAQANVVLGDLMAARVPKAVVIHNWADAALRRRCARAASARRVHRRLLRQPRARARVRDDPRRDEAAAGRAVRLHRRRRAARRGEARGARERGVPRRTSRASS